jgi:hypothetical protein
MQYNIEYIDVYSPLVYSIPEFPLQHKYEGCFISSSDSAAIRRGALEKKIFVCVLFFRCNRSLDVKDSIQQRYQLLPQHSFVRRAGMLARATEESD